MIMLIDIETIVTLENSGEIMELGLSGSNWHSGLEQIISLSLRLDFSHFGKIDNVKYYF